jgi:hypothetical protein
VKGLWQTFGGEAYRSKTGSDLSFALLALLHLTEFAETILARDAISRDIPPISFLESISVRQISICILEKNRKC